MNEASGSGGYAELLQRRKNWIITIVPAALLLAVYLAYALQAQYRSTATIILEPSSIPQEFIQTTVANYADQQIEIISGRVMDPEVLKSLVQQYDPYPDETKLSVGEKAHRLLTDIDLERVDPVTLEPLEKSPAFSLHYQNPNPQRASDVTQRLADLFLTYHQRERTRAAQEASKLISDRATELSEELRQVDLEYSDLLSKHADALPDQRDRNDVNLDRAGRDLDDSQRQLRAAQERQSLLAIQLNGLSPNLAASKGDLTDLATVRAQLADAQQRYTPDHPDVKRLQRALAALLAQQGGKGVNPITVKADNPEYQRVASQLDSANKEVIALQAAVQRDTAELSRYSEAMHASPELQRQYADLQRRRDSLQTQFQQVQEKLKGAELGVRFEADKQGEHFSEIRAPFPAGSPFFPNRIGLILLGLVLGGTIAAIAVAIVESSDATVRGARDIAASEDLPLLGGVPQMLRPDDDRRRKFVWGTVGAAYAAATAIVAITIVHAHIRASAVQSVPSRQESKPL